MHEISVGLPHEIQQNIPTNPLHISTHQYPFRVVFSRFFLLFLTLFLLIF